MGVSNCPTTVMTTGEGLDQNLLEACWSHGTKVGSEKEDGPHAGGEVTLPGKTPGERIETGKWK